MVWMNRGRRVLRGGVGTVAAGGFILAAIGGAAVLAAAEGAPLSFLALDATVVAGLGAAWWQGQSASGVANKASADLDVVAKRLI